MALHLLLHRIYVPTQLETLWLLIWIASVTSGSTFTKSQPKSKDSTFVSDDQNGDFNIVNSSLFTKLLPRHDDFVLSESKSFEEDDVKTVYGGTKQNHDNTSILNDRDIFLNPQVLFHQENKQNLNVNSENDKQNNFKTKGHFLISNETDNGLKTENKDALNLTLTNHTQLDSQGDFNNASVNVLGAKSPTKNNLLSNKSVSEDKLLKTNLSDTALFNKYLIAERKKAASHFNSTLLVNKHKQKIFYHDSTVFNEPALMNDQPVQVNISDEKMKVSVKSSNERDDDDNIELGDHNSTTVIDSSLNETNYNDSSNAISHIMPPDQSDISFNTIVITGVSVGVIIMGGIMAAGSYVIYRHRYWNKPQTLSDKCSNADSSGYIDDSTLRENSEEMYSLDNDSFLNSLEAMTIQNYWTDNVKHTKL